MICNGTPPQVHHDLKAKNFVRFFDGRYCLVDFDNCRTVNKQDMGNTTMEICPPEVSRRTTTGGGLLLRAAGHACMCMCARARACVCACMCLRVCGQWVALRLCTCTHED